MIRLERLCCDLYRWPCLNPYKVRCEFAYESVISSYHTSAYESAIYESVMYESVISTYSAYKCRSSLPSTVSPGVCSA